MIALSDTRGYEAVLDGDEKQILEQLIERVQALDPDVIEGTTCSGSICRIWRRVRRRWARRCDWARRVGAALGVAPPVHHRREQPHLHTRVCSRTPPDRHLPERATLRHRARRLGELRSQGSHAAAGIAAPDRIYLEREQIPDLWRTDPETVRRYCLQDVHETRRLADLTLPTEFYQCQMLPTPCRTSRRLAQARRRT
jgi:hypothetical protein